jgi:hypothetical protein
MPTFEIEAPSGQKFRIDAPEGATPEKAFEYFKTTDQYKQAKAPEVSGAGAFGRAAAEGLTGGFYKELRGLAEAGGAGPEDYTLPSVPTGAYRYFTGEKGAEEAYEAGKKREKERYERIKKEYPMTTMGGEILGSIPTMAAVPELAALKGAGFAGRLTQGALTGAGYGALTGAAEGEGAANRALGAALGTTTGALGGALGTAGGTVLEKAGERYLKPVASAISGWKDAAGEASKRMAGAIMRDQEDILAGRAQGLSYKDWVAARNRGEPVTFADLGAGNVKALLRSAANTSPEGRAIIEKALHERFVTQSERIASDVRSLSKTGQAAGQTRDELIEKGRQQAEPLYQKAFARPRAQAMWDDTLEQIAQAPSVQKAINLAMIDARSEATKLGLQQGVAVTPPRLPFAQDASGRYVLDRSQGVTPNLQFWDAVKKKLDKLGTGADSEAREFAKSLRNHLDTLVPEYKTARGFAAGYKGGENAIEEGMKDVGKISPYELDKKLKQMNPTNQELYKEGWASQLSDNILKTADTRNAVTALLKSPTERKNAEILFGKQGLDKLTARLDLEKIMQSVKQMLGNSTTAAQLIEAGLAGGAIGSYFGDWEKGAALGVGARAGASKVLKEEVLSGARQMIGYVDKNTAKKVAESLMSDDPRILKEGLERIANSPKLGKLLASIADRVSQAAALQAAQSYGTDGIRTLTIPGPSGR